VGQLVGGGGNLGLYEIKHARGKYPNPPPEASRNRRFSWGSWIAAFANDLDNPPAPPPKIPQA
jgi:hypothetical protein